MTALRIPVPSQTQERARNAANMLASVASTLQGFTTADGVVSAEIKLKRVQPELTALLVAIRTIKRDAAQAESDRAKDREIVERSRVMMEVVG